MKKSYFLSVCGGLMLMGGTAAQAAIVDVGPNGFEAYFGITNFLPPVTAPGTGVFNVLVDPIGGATGQPAILTINDQTVTGGVISLFPGWLDLKYDPSPCNPPNTSGCTPITDPNDPNYVPSNDTSTFQAYLLGDIIVDVVGASSVTYQFPGVNPPVSQVNITYNGLASIAGQTAPVNGSLSLAITATDHSLSMVATENCISGACLEQILALLDAGTQNPGVMNGILFVPEPASLALLSAGLFGLGWTRRMQKAA